MAASKQTVNLILLTEVPKSQNWKLGSIFHCPGNNSAIHTCLISELEIEPADAWLFWDSTLGQTPNHEYLDSLLSGPGDVWHAGLQMGLQGQPPWIDFVTPTWMLNRDPDPDITASSWRLSLRACLIRSEVLRQLGGPDPHFQSLEAAGLEMGLRYIRHGAFVQHVPNLVAPQEGMQPVTLPVADQARFIRSGFGRRWVLWAGFRAVASGTNSPKQVLQALQQAPQKPLPERTKPYQRPEAKPIKPVSDARVTVLIPTINRYAYLRTLLNQLRYQTIPPLEVIVVDQTPAVERDEKILDEFSDLPLRWFSMDYAGQCTSRNSGLNQAKGEYILFIDDDDEIPPDLIEKHLARLQNTPINISSGVANEVGAGALPPDFQFSRISNVFPTNNTMIRKRILGKSGLFDLAYDHGQRADHDLGMRLYLNGELLVLNPEIVVLHHHAPIGGLRVHKARVSTYAGSRNSLLKIDLPTVSDIYLAKRYYSNRQVTEMLWISVLGTFSIHGPRWKLALKALLSFLRLPVTIWQINKRSQMADALLKDYPQIPALEQS